MRLTTRPIRPIDSLHTAPLSAVETWRQAHFGTTANESDDLATGFTNAGTSYSGTANDTVTYTDTVPLATADKTVPTFSGYLFTRPATG